jgi:hypothetical protein
MVGVRFVWLERLRLQAHNLLNEYRFGGEDQDQVFEQVYRREREATRRAADIPSYFPALA